MGFAYLPGAVGSLPSVRWAVSYTEAHPVCQNYECRACQVSMSGDHCTDEAVAMFNERHKECEQ